MKELVLSPEELYFLGTQMKGRHIDYAYIAAMGDIQQYKALYERECREALKAAGVLEEDFWEELTVDGEAAALLSPVFSGDFQSQVQTLEKDGGGLDVRLHRLEGRYTWAELVGGTITLRAAEERDIEGLAASLAPPSQGAERGIVLKNLNDAGEAIVSVYRAQGGQLWEPSPSGGWQVLPYGDFINAAMDILKGA